jgi:hypothetical protein
MSTVQSTNSKLHRWWRVAATVLGLSVNFRQRHEQKAQEGRKRRVGASSFIAALVKSKIRAGYFVFIYKYDVRVYVRTT